MEGSGTGTLTQIPSVVLSLTGTNPEAEGFAVTDATGINVFNLIAVSDTATLNTIGFNISGILNFVEAEATSLATALADSGISVLAVNGKEGQLTVKNTGIVDINVTSVGGVDLSGLNLANGNSWQSTAPKESYAITSDADAIAVSIGTAEDEKATTGEWTNAKGTFSATATANGAGNATAVVLTGASGQEASGTWNGSFEATATSNGSTFKTPTVAGTAVAVNVGENATAEWTGGFSATATSTGLSPSATALLVGASDQTNPIQITNAGTNATGTITLKATVTTAGQGESTLTSLNGYSAIGVSYEGTQTDTDGGVINGHTTVAKATDYGVSISSILNITNAGDLSTKLTGGDNKSGQATGVLVSGEGTLGTVK